MIGRLHRLRSRAGGANGIIPALPQRSALKDGGPAATAPFSMLAAQTAALMAAEMATWGRQAALPERAGKQRRGTAEVYQGSPRGRAPAAPHPTTLRFTMRRHRFENTLGSKSAREVPDLRNEA